MTNYWMIEGVGVAVDKVYPHLDNEKVARLLHEQFPENEEMHIRKICIYMGVQKSYHNNTSVLCYNGRSYISFTRTIEESSIEEEFFRRLRKLGLKVTIDTDFML